MYGCLNMTCDFGLHRQDNCYAGPLKFGAWVLTRGTIGNKISTVYFHKSGIIASSI